MDDVAGSHVLLRLGDDVEEVRLRDVGEDPRIAGERYTGQRIGRVALVTGPSSMVRWRAAREWRRRGVETVNERLDPACCLLVGSAHVAAGPLGVGQRDHVHGVLDVVEGHEAVHAQQQAVRNLEIVRRGHRQPLESADGFVADVADKAANKAGQPRRRDLGAAVQQVTDQVERVSIGLLLGRATP